MRLFLYGTLQDPDVFKIVTGKELESKPAVLKDHTGFFVQNELYPGLASSVGESLPGLLTTVDIKSLERIHHFEESGQAYELKELTVQVRETQLKAFAFYPLSELALSRKVWSYPVWKKIHKKSFLEEARLFMQTCP